MSAGYQPGKHSGVSYQRIQNIANSPRPAPWSTLLSSCSNPVQNHSSPLKRLSSWPLLTKLAGKIQRVWQFLRICHILSDMETSANPELLELDPNGRIVIPAALRRALNLKAGDKLVAWVNEGQLIIRSRAELVRELRAKFQRAPGEESLTRVLRRARDREVSHGVKR